MNVNNDEVGEPRIVGMGVLAVAHSGTRMQIHCRETEFSSTVTAITAHKLALHHDRQVQARAARARRIVDISDDAVSSSLAVVKSVRLMVQ